MRGNKKYGTIFWGLLFILGAIYLVASKIWILPQISIFTVLLTAFVVSLFVKGVKEVDFWKILFAIAFACILYDEPLGITHLTPWTVLGAAFLGSIGMSMLIKPRRNSHPHINLEIEAEKGTTEEWIEGQIRVTNTFGETTKYINSDNFTGGTFENNFGSLSVYLDNAVIQGGLATIRVDNNFGATELFIPREWRVINNLGHTFGNVEERGRYEGSSECMLVIEGDTNFGEIEIHYI